MMKKILILLIAFILFTPLCSFSEDEKKKIGHVAITYETKDSFVIKSKLYYPAQQKPVYPLVVFLHSLGYSGEYWSGLVKKFVDAGYAALVVDLRGHGQSAYDSSFKIHSWVHFTQKQYAKYPEDVAELMNYVASGYKNLSTTNYVIIGADVGANTAILVSEKLTNKPKGLVLISPSRDFKGLYTPIPMTNLGPIPILTAVSAQDRYFYNEATIMKRYAQGSYEIKTYPSGGTGMLMIKTNYQMSYDILDWVTPLIQ